MSEAFGHLDLYSIILLITAMAGITPETASEGGCRHGSGDYEE